MRFRVTAVACDGNGPFDQAYSFGSDGELTGGPNEIAQAVAELLAGLSPDDCRAMQHGTGTFYLQLTIAPEEP